MALLALVLPTVSSHYMWLSRTHGDAVATFSESPVGAGMAMFIKSVENRTSVRLSVGSISTSLPLTLAKVGTIDADLKASLPASVSTSATMLEGAATWGLFPEINRTSPPLLQYWFSAHHALKPHDWFYIDKQSTNRLTVTLRAEPCGKGASSAKAVALARFDGRNLGSVTVDLFDAAGKASGSIVTTEHGVATLTLPAGQAAFAKIKHIEHAHGVDPASGKTYEEIAHYATASVLVGGCGTAEVKAEVEAEAEADAEAAASPNPFPSQSAKAAAETARWITHTGSWGYVTSLDSSERANTPAPAASVLSFSDGAAGKSTGRLFFYIMGGFQAGGTSDRTTRDDPYDASLTISQAALNHTTSCDAAKVDAEDPRCAKLTLSGKMGPAKGDAATLGKAALFARHPQMKQWPASHGFQVYELLLTDICKEPACSLRGPTRGLQLLPGGRSVRCLAAALLPAPRLAEAHTAKAHTAVPTRLLLRDD